MNTLARINLARKALLPGFHSRVLAAWLAVVFSAALSGSVYAHPHVWVISRTTVLFKDGAMTGLQHDWTFDEMYAAMAIEGLDTNKDGKYDRSELQSLAQVNIDGLKDFEYFTAAEAQKKPLKFSAPVDYWLEYTNNVLILHLTLPLVEPLPAKGQKVSIWIEDPSFFIAFDPAKDDPIKLAPNAPQGCTAKMAAATATQKNLSDAFNGQLSASTTAHDAALEVSCLP